MIGAVKKNGIKLVLSVNTLNDSIRRKIMGYKKDFKIVDKIRLLDKHNIKYECWFVPLKSLIESGDTEKSFDYLVNSTKTTKLAFSTSAPTKFIPKNMREELLVDKSVICRLLDEYNGRIEKNICIKKRLNHKDSSLTWVVSTLRSLIKGKRNYLVLSPKGSCDMIRSVLNTPNVHVQPVSSFLGEHVSVAGVLTIRDYLSSLKKTDFDYDCVIIPYNSFDVNFDDFTLFNVNELYAKIRKPLILV